jgi:hypothetical protein
MDGKFSFLYDTEIILRDTLELKVCYSQFCESPQKMLLLVTSSFDFDMTINQIVDKEQTVGVVWHVIGYIVQYYNAVCSVNV